MKTHQSGCQEYNSLSRRSFLRGVGTATAAATLGVPWLPKTAFAKSAFTRDVIVSVYLRGGADGLTLCVPHGEPNYYAIRPVLAVPPPGSGRTGACTDLDGLFGFPVAFTPLLQPFRDGKLAVVHAVGQPNWTRSHFQAQHWMEAADRDPFANSGWLGRHLGTVGEMLPGSILRGLSLTDGMALTLEGGLKSLPILDPDKFGYAGGLAYQDEVITTVGTAYSAMHDATRQAFANTRNTIGLLDQINFAGYQPKGGAVYTTGDSPGFGLAMKSTAALLKAHVGLEAVHIDFVGWDTHVDQGSVGGRLDNTMQTLGQNLGAFYKDMTADHQTNWIVVVVSEFGRNAVENGARGTDHGYGNCMLVMGGAVNGGQVYRQWPGLDPEDLFEHTDLAATIDFRDVLSEIVQKRLENNNLGAIFPGYTPQFRGIVN